jgi:VIT1/CCC1 family predicted Fe2+/Mn2+ transporter
VFGIEDGMVSTLGALTGIAIGSSDRFMVILSGFVIIAVESISMGIGSFISNKSFKEAEDKVVEDEKQKLIDNPKDERASLYKMLLRDGWSRTFARKMTKSASLNSKLMLREHEYRELGVFPYQKLIPSKNALFMLLSYMLGGFFPLISYILFPLSSAIYVSVVLTVIGLFLLGAITTFYTNAKPITAGLRLVAMGGTAFVVGVLVGELASNFPRFLKN